MTKFNLGLSCIYSLSVIDGLGNCSAEKNFFRWLSFDNISGVHFQAKENELILRLCSRLVAEHGALVRFSLNI